MKNNLFLSYDEYVGLSETKDKTTYVMATSQVDIKILMWSVFSLILRSNSNYIEHYAININGPHKKTGDPTSQNIKQKFFEILRDDYDFPATISRIWGRQGHTNAIDSLIPWIHTEYYTLVHDDVILLEDWTNYLDSFLSDENRCIISASPFFINNKFKCKFKNRPRLSLPHINSSFLHVKKSNIKRMWHGHHVSKKIKLDKELYNDFISYYKDFNYSKEVQCDDEFEYINTDVGSWIIKDLHDNNSNIHIFSSKICHHISMASWANEMNLSVSLSNCLDIIKKIEQDILNSKYKNLYSEFSNYSNIVI